MINVIARVVGDCTRPGLPEATEWQPVADQIDAAMIFVRADFVNVL